MGKRGVRGQVSRDMVGAFCHHRKICCSLSIAFGFLKNSFRGDQKDGRSASLTTRACSPEPSKDDGENQLHEVVLGVSEPFSLSNFPSTKDVLPGQLFHTTKHILVMCAWSQESLSTKHSVPPVCCSSLISSEQASVCD